MEATENGGLLDDSSGVLLLLSKGSSSVWADSLHEPPENSGNEVGHGLCTEALPGEDWASFVMTPAW
jgi:hypothetical protein